VTYAQILVRLTVVFTALASTNCNEAASPTVPSSPTSPVTVVYESQLYPRGAASRTLAIALAGNVTVTLTSVRPDSSVVLGLGLGIPRADGGGCLLSYSVSTVSGTAPQLTAVTDPGTYCIKVFDTGALTNDLTFSITIVHP
jgi:hypothetical protein